MRHPSFASGPFSPAALVLLISSALALFALSVLLHAYEGPVSTSGAKTRPGSYSVSAVGYAGFYDALRLSGRPAVRSSGNTLALVGGRGTLIVAEPDLGRVGSDESLQLLSAPRLLLVLPKWRGMPDESHPGWVERVELTPPYLARDTLALVTGRGDVVRAVWPGRWEINRIGIAPSDPAGPDGGLGGGIVQLVRSRDLRPLVGNANGMLLGEMRDGGQTIWVLADPDVLANHGIGKGDNAAFMFALVDRLRMQDNADHSGRIVFDETVHGFRAAEGSPVKLMFEFPFVVVTVLLCVSAALLVLAGAGRFGAPRVPAPELDFGKSGLIGNSSRLLDYAGHHADVLKRYVRMTVRAAAQSLHAPPGLSGPALAAWLDRVGKARGVEASCAAILQTVDNLNAGDARSLGRLFDSCRDIHRWKGEILDGSASRRLHG